MQTGARHRNDPQTRSKGGDRQVKLKNASGTRWALGSLHRLSSQIPKQRDTKAKELTMSSLKKMIVIGATALTLGAGAAVSAQAQQLNTPYVDSLDWRITNAAQQGRISWGEARDLRRELRSVHDLAWRNQTGQINRWQYQRLASVVHHIEMRTSGYAYNDRRDRWGRDDYGNWRH